MRQKKYVNILIVIGASAILLLLWFNGFSWLYAQMLRIGANILLVFSGDTSISLKMVDNAPTFVVDTIINGKKGTYPQKADLILLPFIMILTWQILLFFNLPAKKAWRSAAENIITFFIIQLVYVLLLTGYHNSSGVKFIYDLLLDSFYIIALFLVVKDAFKYELIGLTKKDKQ
ncbi:MAG TPA: hypothetical protein PLW31_12235 [Bacteroidales bacterium]|jgi:hypothetical protein|nr:hypothetical protein [Bacteroidales bacterium]HNQ83378.1 hypothetical protein [Bacteroidales bacterium]HOX78790.1 hypothetical protein [Bacteroidales bacterium]HPI85756.1 hypothetical protein [Bacteroidales bacterium]